MGVYSWDQTEPLKPEDVPPVLRVVIYSGRLVEELQKLSEMIYGWEIEDEDIENWREDGETDDEVKARMQGQYEEDQEKLKYHHNLIEALEKAVEEWGDEDE